VPRHRRQAVEDHARQNLGKLGIEPANADRRPPTADV
jgi:hypothetical protein